MRKKIGKRIGPVPIALVAVLALAAFLSAGLLLTTYNGVTQAQGLPTATPLPGPDDKDCEVVLVADTGLPGTLVDLTLVDNATVQGGGCEVSGDSLDVEFLNYSDTENEEPSVVVYVTGGDDYSNVQAMGIKPEATEVGPLGARGVDEYAFTVEMRSDDAFNRPTPGSESITVTRDMAKDGEIYLFLYQPSLDAAFVDEQIGMPLSILAEPQSKWPPTIRTAVYTDAEAKVALAIIEANDAFAAARMAEAISGLDPEFQSSNVGVRATYLADVMVLAGNQTGDFALADEIEKLRTATIGLNRIKSHADYGDDAVAGVGQIPAIVGTAALEDDVEDAEEAIVTAQAAIDGAEDSDPRHFFNMSTAKLAVKVVFRDTATAAKLVAGAYNPIHEDGTMGSTLVVGRASTGVVNDREAPDDLTATSETADVTVRIRDSRGVALKGFVDLSIDTSAAGAADAVFTKSARSTYYTELGVDPNDAGTVTVEIEDLPQNDPLRIPVTASFNNGELELTANIVRKGDAVMVVAEAYACEPDSDDEEDGVCASEITALGNSNTSDDPDKVIALGPDDSFVINGKATDAVGNTVGSKGQLTWEITKGADNEDDAEESLEASNGKGLEKITVTGDDDAAPGTYSLTVTSPDGEASEIIMITVSDDASMITVSCDPEMIATDSGLTDCTVTVADANGNIPSNLHEEKDKDGDTIADTVRVAVRSTDVSISGVDDSDDAELDDEGMATFSILLREDAQEGSITVFVSSEIGDEMLRASTSVMYGEAALEPMPMTLGNPSITSAMSDAAGMATIMLMPGDNADQHWIWALPTDLVSEGMYSDRVAGDATSFTMSGLTSGMSYWFTAVAGRDMEDGTQEWSMFSDWSAGTLIE